MTIYGKGCISNYRNCSLSYVWYSVLYRMLTVEIIKAVRTTLRLSTIISSVFMPIVYIQGGETVYLIFFGSSLTFTSFILIYKRYTDLFCRKLISLSVINLAFTAAIIFNVAVMKVFLSVVGFILALYTAIVFLYYNKNKRHMI